MGRALPSLFEATLMPSLKAEMMGYGWSMQFTVERSIHQR
jgi:hypothetical protein